MTDKQKFSLIHPLRVRWAEVDMQGIVFNGHYLAYFDVGVTEYYRAIGHPYPGSFAGAGTDLFVKKAEIEYHAPAAYDDLASEQPVPRVGARPDLWTSPEHAAGRSKARSATPR